MDETVGEALRWINEVRAIRGDHPLLAMPQGIPCDPHGCPVARALDAEVTFDGVAFARAGGWPPVHLPPAARAFANDFDVGLHPELESAGAAGSVSIPGVRGLVSISG